jgi:hypothetical protein
VFQGVEGEYELALWRRRGLDLAKIDLADNLGLAVNALAIASVVVGVAIDLLGGKARHI